MPKSQLRTSQQNKKKRKCATAATTCWMASHSTGLRELVCSKTIRIINAVGFSHEVVVRIDEILTSNDWNVTGEYASGEYETGEKNFSVQLYTLRRMCVVNKAHAHSHTHIHHTQASTHSCDAQSETNFCAYMWVCVCRYFTHFAFPRTWSLRAAVR